MLKVHSGLALAPGPVPQGSLPWSAAREGLSAVSLGVCWAFSGTRLALGPGPCYFPLLLKPLWRRLLTLPPHLTSRQVPGGPKAPPTSTPHTTPPTEGLGATEAKNPRSLATLRRHM